MAFGDTDRQPISGCRVAGAERDGLIGVEVGQLTPQLLPDPAHRLRTQRQPQRRVLVADRLDDRRRGPGRVT